MKHLKEALYGAVDLHVHSAPDVDPRRYNDLELAREAAAAGMRALLIKSHQNSTVERAWLVHTVVPGIDVFGGLVLNSTVGGLNTDAVEVAIRLGARQIWMPTRSARNHRRHHQQPGGISILDAEGRLGQEACRIVELIAASDCILGTGHLAPEEGVVLLRHAAASGVKRLMVTHPEWPPTAYSIELQKELAALGVFFERCFVSTTHRCGFVPIATIAGAIDGVGVESTILASDLGQPDTPAPVDGLSQFAGMLQSEGFSCDQIHRMMVCNPAFLLGLDSVSSLSIRA
jgi:hypothetical protein